MADEKSSRFRRAPTVPLQDAVAALNDICNAVGGASLSREKVAQALGHKSENGASNSKIGAMVHFGLLERRGNVYAVSSLGKQILQEEGQGALKVAVQNPRFYAELLEKYRGKALPSSLARTLQLAHDVPAASAEAVASRFIQSIEYAGVLTNGIVMQEPASEDFQSAESHPIAVSPERRKPDEASEKRAHAPGMGRYSFPLDREGRAAFVEIPLPIKATYLDRLLRWADYMKASMQEEDVTGRCPPPVVPRSEADDGTFPEGA